MLPNPRFSGAAKKASCDRQLAHFRPVFTRIPADPRYPYPRLLRIDRVDATGEILHPYAVEPVPDGDGWRILVYAPFIEAFSTLPEAEFVRLRTAGREDFEARKQI